MTNEPHYVSRLRAEFSARSRQNPAYSLRAFAAKLGISSGTLSAILAGKRGLSRKLAPQVAKRLGLSPVEQTRFEVSAGTHRLLKTPDTRQPEPRILEEEIHFRIISEWEHFAILSLAEAKEPLSITQMGARLKISPTRVKDSVDRLLHAGLLESRSNGRGYRPTQASLRTTEDTRSAALRKAHRETLARAARSLEEVEPELRDLSAITMLIDRELLPEAKLLIRDFRKKLATLVERGDRKDVYRLAIQLFPLREKSK